MHPILGHLRRMVLYLAAWIPLAALLAYLLANTHAMDIREALVLAFPLCLVYAFVCLSAWYPCRVTPLERTGASKLAATHFLGALVATALWIFVAKMLTDELSESAAFRGLDRRFAAAVPLLVGTGVLFYLLSVAFYYILLGIEVSRDAEARVMQASMLAREAELRALKAQVNPHFLFNSLNSISALTGSDPAKAREMCILLGDFLRRTLGLGEKSAIPLGEELSLIHAFLAVEKIRFGSRLNMVENVDPQAVNIAVPPLLLQPLVENAVAHGIANLVEGGCIQLNVALHEGVLSILVENSFDPDAPVRHRNGVGLANVRQRLEARYGNRAKFGAQAAGTSFRVALEFPAEQEASAS
ncbi:MAG: histidine kinase [Acidobacteriota bacterium]|nr:histidine kinase [Acidobacteriota bacterium]